MIKIYLDVYFFVNLALDYISFYVALSVFSLNFSFRRVFLSSLLGSVFSLVMLFSPRVLSITLLAPTALILCYIASRRLDLRVFFFFFITEIFFGGVITSLGESIAALVPALLCALPVYLALQRRAKKSLDCIPLHARVSVSGEEFVLNLFIDSGNLALDPETKRRVIFIGTRAWKSFLSRGVYPRQWYSLSIRGASGKSVMRAFVPDKIEFDRNEYNKESFLVLPSPLCHDFAGFDGIAPMIR